MTYDVALPIMLGLSFVAGGCLLSAYWLSRVRRLEERLRWERKAGFDAGWAARGRSRLVRVA